MAASTTALQFRAPMIAGAILALAAGVPSAQGIVVEGMQSMPRPAGAAVGLWNGSSGVPIAPQWFITAKHTGGSVNQWFWCNGSWHMTVEVRLHPTMDLQMIRVAESFESWHRIAEGVVPGDPCIMGGYGVTAGAPLANNAGYDWNGPHEETWGANIIQNAATVASVRFDAPGTGNAVPYEASFGINDSGGGLFTWGADGKLELAGIAVSVSGFGQAAYGQNGYAVLLESVNQWIMEAADPEMPISSSVVAPRLSMLGGAWPAAVAAGSLILGLASIRRRVRS